MSWEDEHVWTCIVCGTRAACRYVAWWRDDGTRTDVPGGVTIWAPTQPRCGELCSKTCARAFAKAAGRERIMSIRTPATERWWRENLSRSNQPMAAQPKRAA